MIVTSAKETLHAASGIDGFDDVSLCLRRDSVQYLYDHRNDVPGAASIEATALMFSDQLGIHVGPEKVRAILMLFPEARITLANGSVGDTDVDHMLLDALSGFTLRCDWPINKDNFSPEGMKKFMKLLTHTFLKIKF